MQIQREFFDFGMAAGGWIQWELFNLLALNATCSVLVPSTIPNLGTLLPGIFPSGIMPCPSKPHCCCRNLWITGNFGLGATGMFFLLRFHNSGYGVFHPRVPNKKVFPGKSVFFLWDSIFWFKLVSCWAKNTPPKNWNKMILASGNADNPVISGLWD